MSAKERALQALDIAEQQGDQAAVTKLVAYIRILQEDENLSRRTTARRETGVFEDITSGFGAGVVGVGEMAALGGAAALEEETELAARERIKSAADYLRPEGGDPESISYKVSSALGSIAGLAAVPIGAAVAGAPGLAAAGLGALAAAGAGAGEASERAREADASEEDRGAAAGRGVLIGLLDVIPVARVIKYADIPKLNKLTEAFEPTSVTTKLGRSGTRTVETGAEQINKIGQRIVNAAKTGGLEAAQEAASGILQNVNQQQYDALAETFAGVGEEAALGGAAGAILQGLVDLFVPRGRRGPTVGDTAGDTALPVIPEGASAQTQGELFDIVEGPRESVTAEQVQAKLLAGFGNKNFAELTDQEQQQVETRIRQLSDEEFAVLDKVIQPPPALRAPQQSLPGLEPEKTGADIGPRQGRPRGLPAPEGETIAGETIAVTPEGEAIRTREEQLARDKRDAEERAEDDAVRADTPSEEVLDAAARRQREAAEPALDRGQTDMFPVELDIAERQARNAPEYSEVRAKVFGRLKKPYKELTAKQRQEVDKKVAELPLAEQRVLESEVGVVQPPEPGETKIATPKFLASLNIPTADRRAFEGKPIDYVALRKYANKPNTSGIAKAAIQRLFAATPKAQLELVQPKGLKPKPKGAVARARANPLKTATRRVERTEKKLQEAKNAITEKGKRTQALARAERAAEKKLQEARAKLSVARQKENEKLADTQPIATTKKAKAKAAEEAKLQRKAGTAIGATATSTGKPPSSKPVEVEEVVAAEQPLKGKDRQDEIDARVELGATREEARESVDAENQAIIEANKQDPDSGRQEAFLDSKTEQDNYPPDLRGTNIYAAFASSKDAPAIDVPLEGAVLEALRAGDLRKALLGIARTTKSRQVRRIANKLSKSVGDTTVGIVGVRAYKGTDSVQTAQDKTRMLDLQKEGDGLTPAGLFSSEANRILLNEDGGLNVYTLLHEMAHAATIYQIKTNPQSAAVKRLKAIYKANKGKLAKAYGEEALAVADARTEKSEDGIDSGFLEFVAEAFSNPEFQRELGTVNVGGGPLSSWQRLVEWLSEFFGFDKFSASARADTNRLMQELLAPARKFRFGPTLAAFSTSDGVKEVMGGMDSVQKGLGKYTKEFGDRWANEAIALFRGENRITDKVKNAFLGTAPLQALTDIAKKFNMPSSFDLYKAIVDQRGDLNIAEESVRKVLVPLGAWYKNNRANGKVDAFNELVTTSTIEEVDPSLTRKEAEDKYGETLTIEAVAGDDAPPLRKIDVWEEMQPKWNSLGREGQQQYVALRDMYKAQYDALLQSIRDRIDNTDGLDAAGKATLKDKIFAKMLAESSIEPYFPLTRRGDYWLRHTRKGEPVIEAFESPGARLQAMKEHKADPDASDVQTFDKIDLKTFSGSPPSSFVGQTMAVLQKSDVSPEVQEQIMRLFIEALPESSFAKALARRKRTKGFEEDALVSATTRAYDLARQTERLKNAAKIRAVMDRIKAEAVKAREDGEEVDADVLRELELRADFAVSPPKDGIAKSLNRAAFIWTIGFNASSALVNMSQVPLFAVPMLSGKYGMTNTKREVGRAYKLFGGSGFFKMVPDGKGGTTKKRALPSLDNYYEIARDEQGKLIATVRTDRELTPEQITELENIAPLIARAAQEGQLNTSFLADTMGLDESGRDTNFMDKVASMSAIMFHGAELANRQVTMVTAYNLELQRIKDKNGGKDYTVTQADKEAAAQEAMYRTQEINGGSVLETAPRLAQAGVGRVALMYKTFGIQMYYTMLKTGKQLVDAQFAGNKELRNEAFRQLVGIHLSALFFAGAQGLPLFGAATMIANLFLDDDEDDAQTIVRKYLGEGWYKGAFTHLTGMDVSQRTALTNLVFQENRFNNAPSPEETFMYYLGGPAWSVGSRFIKGSQEVIDGELERGIESMMPGAVRNAYKAVVRYPRDEGVLTRRGDPIYDDITGGDLLGQLLGFAPSEYTFRQERNSNLKRIDKTANSRRTKLLRKYYIARSSGDTEGMREVRKEMREFDRRHPSARISTATINRSMAQHKETTKNMKKYNGVTFSPYMQRAVDANAREYD